ncbi:MAG: hypothetical protein HC899_06110 [Leptolyngbyaceae cyanobacterium SM1_4_3]|nr:hypothetical protein [Leptolyngbyaceae cyanobacterium SM1_4_3]
MKIQPLAVGLLGLIATGGIVYGAVNSVEPASVALPSTSTSSDSSSPLPSSFPLLETPVASISVDDSSSAASPEQDSSSAASPEQEQPSTPLYKQLEGTWSSDLMTVTFDWKQGVYSGVLLDQPFSKSLELVREQENAVVFTTNGSEMIGEFQPDGTIALVAKGEDDPPIVLRKAG